MGIVISGKLTKKDLDVACEEYGDYMKITIDINRKIVAIGGEYHADSEKILIEKYHCYSSDIWGGGYRVSTKQFETNAILNIKPNLNNPSPEILDPQIRNKFLNIAKEKLSDIESLI